MVTYLIVCFAFNCFVSFECLVFCNGSIVGGLVWRCCFLGCFGIVCYYDLGVTLVCFGCAGCCGLLAWVWFSWFRVRW